MERTLLPVCEQDEEANTLHLVELGDFPTFVFYLAKIEPPHISSSFFNLHLP